MRLSAIATLLTGLVAAAVLTTAADAQTPRKKRIVTRDGYTVIVSRDETGRTRTKVVVQRRSYLDGGTEVAPGERKFSDYYNGPNAQISFGTIDNTPGSHRHPLAGPFDLPGKNNPVQW